MKKTYIVLSVFALVLAILACGTNPPPTETNTPEPTQTAPPIPTDLPTATAEPTHTQIPPTATQIAPEEPEQLGTIIMRIWMKGRDCHEVDPLYADVWRITNEADCKHYNNIDGTPFYWMTGQARTIWRLVYDSDGYRVACLDGVCWVSVAACDPYGNPFVDFVPDMLSSEYWGWREQGVTDFNYVDICTYELE